MEILSEIDTDEYLADASNMSVCDWGTIIEIEPAVMNILICQLVQILLY